MALDTHKVGDFVTVFMYIGFRWNLPVKTVELPEKKKEKYLEHLSTQICGSHHTTKEAKHLIGMLNHVCLVIPEGHTCMVTLYKF